MRSSSRRLDGEQRSTPGNEWDLLSFLHRFTYVSNISRRAPGASR